MAVVENNNKAEMTSAEEGGGEGEKREKEIRELEEMLSKLNPMAEEFVPSVRGFSPPLDYRGCYVSYPNNNNNNNCNNNNNFGFFMMQQQQQADAFFATGIINPPWKKMNFNQGKARTNSRTARTSMAQREDVIRRTVYVSEIDHQVTEEQLAALFIGCGQVVDCRVCGDPNSVLRFAFIEFTDEEGARNALSLGGTMLGYYPVRVLPSKTAIAPVNPVYLPRSEDEREMCARTIYCTNIDKKCRLLKQKSNSSSNPFVVYRLRLLGDYHHSTRIAFVEFVRAESAIAALNCSGAVFGSLPISQYVFMLWEYARVSPSKTPVRPRAPPRPSMH